MSSQFPRVNVITRQRLLSDDYNNGWRLAAKGNLLTELARALGEQYLAGAAGLGGVIGGFMVRCLPGSNNIEVSPGIAVVEATPTSATYDPPVLFIELDEPEVVDLGGLIDGGNPRLVTIEIQPAEAALVTTAVDVFDTSTGTFGVNPAAARVTGSSPTIVTSAGAAAASPVIAAGTPGRLPLAVVKLAAGQVNFTDEFASVLMCRPILDAPGNNRVPRNYVAGGGCSVGEESGGAIINLTDIYLSRMTASLLGLEAEVSGRIEFATRGRTPDTTDVPTLLASPQPVYGYAAPPPWPADYGDIAPREAWQRNPNAVPLANVQNVVGGDGSTFLSLVAETTSSPGRTLRNAIVIWDNAAPYGLERGAGNAPLQVLDARGPHPDTAPGGAGSITLLAADDPTWGPDQEITETAYLGAVSVITGAANFMAQAVFGNGAIRAIDTIDIIGGNPRRPYQSYNGNASDVAIYPGRFPNLLVGDDEILPDTAQVVDMWTSFEAGTGPGDAQYTLLSEFGFGRTDTGGVQFGSASAVIDTATASDYGVAVEFNRLCRSAAGSVRYSLAIANAGTVLRVGLSGYIDEMLAAR